MIESWAGLSGSTAERIGPVSPDREERRTGGYLLLIRKSLARCAASRQARHMGITVSIPHQLSRAEARHRIETGFAKIIHLLPASAGTCSERWDGDRLIFGVGAMGQTVSGVVSVLDDAVTIDIELPGVLGIIVSGLKDRLQKAGQLLLKKD